MIDPNFTFPAIAAINYALATEEGLTFLDCWLHGDFDVIRREWPDCPSAAFDEAETGRIAVNEDDAPCG